MNVLRNPLVLLVLVAGIGTGVFFYIKTTQKKIPTNPIRTEQPVKKDLTQIVNASGKLKAVVQITVGSLVAGRIIEVRAQDNDIVKKNQILALLDNGIGDSDVKKNAAELACAQATLEYQEKYYARQKALYESGQLAPNTFDSITQTYKTAQANVKKIEAMLEISKKTYENLFVRAPEDSIVISKMVDLGQMVTAQFQATALYTLAANLQDMEAHIDVDEADIGLVKSGQEALCSVDAFPKLKFDAKVKYIKYLANVVDNVVTYDTVINVANPDLKLRPGMTVNVDINVAGSCDAITVPNKALRINDEQLEAAAKLIGMNVVKKINQEQTNAGLQKTEAPKTKARKAIRDYLWIVNQETKTITQVDVTFGATDGKCTEVISGISLTDHIVTEVDDVNRENLLLKGLFGKPSGLGK